MTNKTEMKILTYSTSEVYEVEESLFHMGRQYPDSNLETLTVLNGDETVHVYLVYSGELDNSVVDSWLEEHNFERESEED